MEECEICGKFADKLLKCAIDENIAYVCSDCSKTGRIINEVKNNAVNKFVDEKEEDLFDFEDKRDQLKNDFNILIQRARQKMNLTIKQLAEKLNIKESVMRKIEHKDILPDDETLSKIERFLGVKLKKAEFSIDQLIKLLLLIIIIAITVSLIYYLFVHGQDLITQHIFCLIPGFEGCS